MKVMDKEDRNDYEYYACVWCGNWITQAAYSKRKERQLPDLDVCKDCRDVRKAEAVNSRKKKRIDHPELGVVYCVIWDGELNDDWFPIDDEGKPFVPGERICGFKDCVNTTHVIPPKKMQVSDLELILGMHELQQHNRRNKVR
jgi:hypothetical protein